MEINDYFEAIIDCMGDPIFVTDQQHRYVFVNNSACETLGRPCEELLGKTDYEVFPKELAETLRRHKDAVFVTGMANENEEPTTDLHGNPRVVITKRTLFVSRTGEKYIINTMRDITERKKTEKILLESEAKYRTVVESSIVGVYIIQDNLFRFVNKRWCEIHGYSPDEVIDRMNPLDIIHPEDKKIVEDSFRKRLSGEVINAEYSVRAIRKDGTKIIVDILGSRMVYRNRPAISGTLLDITEQEKAREDLMQKTALLEAQMNASLDGIIVSDKGRKIIENKMFENLFDIPARILESDDDEARIEWIKNQTKDPEYFRRKIDSAFAHPDQTIRDELELRNGKVLDRYSGPVIGKDGKHYGRIWTFRDITERKLAERTLSESEEKYRNVIENSLVGFYILKNGLFRYVNKQFSEITGYTYEEIVDKISPLDIVHPDDREILRENIRKRLGGETDRIDYDFRAVRKDGRILNLKIIGTTMIYEGERVATGTILDVTELKRLEAQFLHSQKMESIGTLAGGIAHDFNNILTALTGYASLMQLKTEKGSPLRPYLDQIFSASKKAADLIQGLLTFSRQQPANLIPLDVNDTIESMEKLLGRLLTEDIEFCTSITKDDTIILADKSQMDQIFFNLVTNARDAMPNGGKLIIETDIVHMDETFIKVHGFGKPGKYVLLTISDTGKGMDEKTRIKIFDPFFTTKDTGKGTGLGLATVYGIVTQNNGYITVYSEPGHGTTFRIYFPSVNAKVEKEIQEKTPLSRGKETILIAEDNDGVRHFMREALRGSGYKIVEAVDGEDAIEKFRQRRNIDLIIVDSVMPKKNGREVYENIHEIDPQIKALFTSGYTKDIVLDKGIKDGEFDFISKPLKLNEFLEKVRNVLDRK